MTLLEHDRDVYARERIRRDLERLAELAPTSLSAHATLFHRTSEDRPVVPARHHEEWVQFAHDVQNYRWIVIICPPGYAKSTWWSVIYPAWRIGVTRGRIRIGLISNTANLTYGFARDIMKTIQDPLFQQVYGVGPDYSRGWRQAQFWTTGSVDPRNSTVLATGIGGPIQGKRFDEIICDDLTTWEDARSDTIMDNQRHFLKALLMKRFPPGDGPPDGKGRMVVAMTRWAERDLVPTFQELGFKVLSMPALGYWDREVDEAGRVTWGEEALWPEMEPRGQLEREREEDPLVFELVKQGNTSVVGGDTFDTEKLNYGPMPRREDLSSIVQYVDTAGGRDRKKGDYFVLATVGLEGEKVWVLHIDRGRYSAPEQEQRVISGGAPLLDGGWGPEQIVVEAKNEGEALYQRLIVETRLPLLRYDPVQDKEFRAIPFANAVNTGKVWIPLDPDGKAPPWVRSFVAELDSFPRSQHDDQVDGVSGAFNHTGSGGPRLRVLSAPGHRGRFRRLR